MQVSSQSGNKFWERIIFRAPVPMACFQTECDVQVSSQMGNKFWRRVIFRIPAVEFLSVGHSSRSLGASELLQKVPSSRSHALEQPRDHPEPNLETP